MAIAFVHNLKECLLLLSFFQSKSVTLFGAMKRRIKILTSSSKKSRYCLRISRRNWSLTSTILLVFQLYSLRFVAVSKYLAQASGSLQQMSVLKNAKGSWEIPAKSSSLLFKLSLSFENPDSRIPSHGTPQINPVQLR